MEVEWPHQTLDVDALHASGWRPTPISEFVFKLVGTCNLACDYCYVYEMADQSWRTKPTRMAPAVVDQAASRIAEHAERHRLPRVRVVLHGGEPLSAGPQAIVSAATALRRRLRGDVGLDLRVQTNATLLDERLLAVMHAHDIRVGVSLDGGPADNDRHRRLPNGRGSYRAAARGLRLLCRGEHRNLFTGLLCVVDVDSDPIEVYESLLEFAPPAIDFLLPHGNWSALPPALRPDSGETPYADWLAAVFDRWYGAAPMETVVRLFQDIATLLLGGRSASEQVGLGPVAYLTVDTDGAFEQGDALKSSFHGAPGTGLNVFTDAVDRVLRHPAVVARQIGLAGLAPSCTRCPVVRVCGGGHFAHRYRRGRGYRHRSVYCADLLALIQHIDRRVRADVGRVR